MSVARVQMQSRSLGQAVTYNAILPETGDGPYPVLLQLHGRTDDANAWIERSNLVRHAEPYPLVIVLPDGGVSAYLNLPAGGRFHQTRYEDFLLNDLWNHVSRIFQVRPTPWAIGGLSMGGYGAIRLGLKYPERFASIWAHSGAYYSRDELDADYGDAADADVYAHAERAARTGLHPIVTFDCGVDDRLVGHSRRLHAHLEAIGLPHTYHEHPGGHTWDYWDTHVQHALAQHARAFGIA